MPQFTVPSGKSKLNRALRAGGAAPVIGAVALGTMGYVNEASAQERGPTCDALDISSSWSGTTSNNFSVDLQPGDKLTASVNGFNIQEFEVNLEPSGQEVISANGPVSGAMGVVSSAATDLEVRISTSASFGSGSYQVTCTAGGSTEDTAAAMLDLFLGHNWSDPHVDDLPGSGGSANASSDGGGREALSVREIANGFNANIDLGAFLAARSTAYGLGVAQDGAVPSIGQALDHAKARFTISTDYVEYDDDDSSADRNGEIFRIAGVGSVRVRDRGRVGGFVSYEGGQVSSTAVDADLDRDGFGLGVFGALELPNDMRVHGEFSYLAGYNDIRIGTATGEFDTDRFELHGRLEKDFAVDRTWARGRVKLDYANEHRSSYTDSLGSLVSADTNTRASVGIDVKVGTTMENFNNSPATYRPWVKVGGSWDYDNEGDFAASPITIFETPDFRYEVGGGLDVDAAHGIIISAGAGYLGSDTNLDGWTVSGDFSVPLATLVPQAGLGLDTGKLSLGVDQERDADAGMATALMARVKLNLN